MSICMHNKLEETLVQRSFKHDESLEIVKHNMIWIQRGPWWKFGGIEEIKYKKKKKQGIMNPCDFAHQCIFSLN